MVALAQDGFRPSLAGKRFCSLPSQSSRSAFNASALAALLQSPALNLKDYEWTEQERPLIAHNQFEHDELMPVIDMASLSEEEGSLSLSERQQQISCVAQMAKASQEWGFFQVINHGVSEELIKKMERHAREFFETLDLEEKKRVLRDASASKPMGYACGGAGTRLKSDLPWMESLQLPCVTKEMEAYACKIWQDGNKDFRNVASEFSHALQKLTLRILEVLIGQLGINMESLGGHVEQGKNSVIRFNHYPPCPQPSLTLGLGAHSDPHLLTVLHQDLVGGLQICKDGQWIAVKPRPNSFVVNIGDALQVWSNDAYKSVEHRAVCNSLKSRLSMAFFLNPIDEATITPATIDPPLYRPFTWKEYRDCMYTSRPRGKSNLLRFKLSCDQPLR